LEAPYLLGYIREQNESEKRHFKCALHLSLSDIARGVGVETLKDIKQNVPDNITFTERRMAYMGQDFRQSLH